MSVRSRNWCFTLNNWTDKEFDKIRMIPCQYMIVGEEVGKEGTKHLQGFVVYENARTFRELKDLLGSRAHIEKCKGTAMQNIEYCSKECNFFEKGTRPKGQGKRTDIDKMKELVKLKAPMKDIVMEAKSFQAVRFAQIAMYYVQEDRVEKPKVYWRWGLAGVGKTKWVFDTYKDIYIKDGTMWWDSYMQNECICIDDFDGKWPYRDLLRLLDRYPYQGQIKGGYVKINSPYIVITCEHPPEWFWEGNELQQVLRRIDDCTQVCAQKSGVILKSPTLNEMVQF